MAVSERQEKNKTVGQELEVLCPECGRETHHVVMVSVDCSGEQHEGDWDFQWCTNYQTIQCGGCKTISFRTASTNSEDMEHLGDNEWDYAVTENLYPLRVKRFDGLEDGVHYLPQNLERVYKETLQALNGWSPVLAGIGVRVLIETVCKEKTAAGRNLLEQIDDLVTKAILTPQGAKTLHKLRILGNQAAHEVKPHTQEQLSLAMDVVEHLLKDVYILPVQVEAAFKDS